MKEVQKNIKIVVDRATEDESQNILDLWKGSARWIQSKGINQWTSAPTKRIAPGDFVALSRWGVVKIRTLDEI
ncbi:hypothetical protein V7139_31275 [Neobacillus drentensis]|uniref:hypothetical protein n=1 Tax=Neobacillus drentensis TaxID=220684 RepID=UPI0030020B0E